LFQRLANAVLYLNASLRPFSETLSQGTVDRTALWAHGISGDLPIALACIDKAEDVDTFWQPPKDPIKISRLTL
jgi:cyclic beta-1,2-glucan synthetase